MDVASQNWLHVIVPHLNTQLFKTRHAPILDRIQWHINHLRPFKRGMMRPDNLPEWIPMWLQFVSSLAWDEWRALDTDLQRLYVLLN